MESEKEGRELVAWKIGHFNFNLKLKELYTRLVSYQPHAVSALTFSFQSRLAIFIAVNFSSLYAMFLPNVILCTDKNSMIRDDATMLWARWPLYIHNTSTQGTRCLSSLGGISHVGSLSFAKTVKTFAPFHLMSSPLHLVAQNQN